MKQKTTPKRVAVRGAQIKPCLENGSPAKGFVLCFVPRPVRKNGKRHVAEYHISSGEKIGFLGPRCTAAWKRKDAVSFPSKAATEFAIFSCELYVRNPGGKNPDRIYKRAEEMR